MKTIFAFLLCLFMSFGAAAQTASEDGMSANTPPMTNPDQNAVQSIASSSDAFINDTLATLNSIEAKLNDAFKCLRTKLASDGQELVGAIFSVMFVWTGLMGLMKGESLGEVLSSVIMQTLTLGIVLLCLDASQQDRLVDTFTAIAKDFGADTTLAGGFKAFFQAIASIWASAASTSGQGFWATLFQLKSTTGGGLAAAMIVILFKAATTIVIIASAGLWAGNYVMSQFKIYIALAIAPVTVPWLMMPYASFLFDGWLKFLIGAGLAKIIGAMMISVTQVLATAMTTIAAGSSDTNIILYAVLMLLALLIAYLMGQINDIAQGLLSGHSRTGFAPGTLANVMNYGPNKMTPRAMGKAYSGGKATMKAAYGGGKSVAKAIGRKAGVFPPASADGAAKGGGADAGGSVKANMNAARGNS